MGYHWIVSVVEEDCVNVESAFATDQIQQLCLKMYDSYCVCIPQSDIFYVPDKFMQIHQKLAFW